MMIENIKSDIFRYCILYDQGGYYFDNKFEVVMSLLQNFMIKILVSF